MSVSTSNPCTDPRTLQNPYKLRAPPKPHRTPPKTHRSPPQPHSPQIPQTSASQLWLGAVRSHADPLLSLATAEPSKRHEEPGTTLIPTKTLPMPPNPSAPPPLIPCFPP